MDLASKLGGLTRKVDGLVGTGKRLADKGKSMLKPPPVVFGAPRQLASDPATSWWHVPVFIQPQTMHKKSLPGCKVKLVSSEGGGTAMDLCWRTESGEGPTREITLAEGRLYLVPVAARKESGDRRVAIITSDSFLAHKQIRMQLPPGQSRWLLRVEGDDGSWESEHSYLLHVPPADRGNGHFTLEVRYKDLN